MTVDTFPYLFWGYTLTWLLIVVYLGFLGKRLCKIEKTLERNTKQ